MKSILSFGVKWHSFNYSALYNKMVNFNNSKKQKKEMSHYTYNELKKCISEEDDLKYKVIFEILYYCVLRKGELKGLAWKDIYFDNKVLSVNKQITQLYNRKGFEFSDTKTRDSRRIVPMTKVLMKDLKELYEYNKKHITDLTIVSS